MYESHILVLIILAGNPLCFQVLNSLDYLWIQRVVFWPFFKVIGFSLYFYILSKFSAFSLILLLLNLFMCDSLNHPFTNSVKSVLQNVHFIIQAWNLFCNPFISLLNCFQSPLGSWPAKIENSHIVSMKKVLYNHTAGSLFRFLFHFGRPDWSALHCKRSGLFSS